MKRRRIFCLALICALTVSILGSDALAAFQEGDMVKPYRLELASIRATGSFNMSIEAKSILKADKELPLDAGETVRINASYTPDASVDFGLVDPDGVFHYFNATDGNIDETIEIEVSGNYVFAVRNNSSKTVKVSGFLNY